MDLFYDFWVQVHSDTFMDVGLNSVTVFILIAAHAPISAHPSYFEVMHHKIINQLPRSIHKANKSNIEFKI